MTTVNFTVANTVDDGTSHNGTAWNDGFIAAGWLGSASRNYWGVCSFPGVTVPQAATILSALWTLYLTILDGGSITYDLIGQAQLVASAAVPDSGNNPGSSGWVHTGATVTYSGVPTVNTDFPLDVTSIIQELVNQGGWVSGNRVNLDLSNNGMSGASDKRLEFYDRASGTAHPAKLDITYTSGGATIGDQNLRANLRGAGLGMARGRSLSPALSLSAYYRERARAQREFVEKVRRAA